MSQTSKTTTVYTYTCDWCARKVQVKEDIVQLGALGWSRDADVCTECQAKPIADFIAWLNARDTSPSAPAPAPRRRVTH